MNIKISPYNYLYKEIAYGSTHSRGVNMYWSWNVFGNFGLNWGA